MGQSSSIRVARNSILLYVRMMLIMIINLYMVRIVLTALGAEDYGIYNVVAGVITMLSCVTTVLSTSTNRFFSYYLGIDDFKKQNEVYACSVRIFLMVSLVVLLLGESIGLWFVTNKLVIPSERLFAAKLVYHFSVFSFVFTILYTPYSSMITAHEDMGAYAVISSLECLLKLICALCISRIAFDHLVFYGLYLMIIPFIILLVYYTFAKTKYPECKIVEVEDNSLYKDIISFSGWTLFGSVAGVGLNQVISILLNIYFGPLANTARGIAVQIYTAIFSFSGSFLVAVKPAIIKSYADSKYNNVNKLFSISNKVVLYLLTCICIPILIRMNYVLDLWLNIDDPQTVLFSQLMVVYAIIMAESSPITYLVQATGNIKNYHIYVESFTLLCPFAVYFLFDHGSPAYTAFIAMIICLLLSHIVRLICLKNIYNSFSFYEYCSSFLSRGVFVIVISIPCVYALHTFLPQSLGSFILLECVSITIVLLLGYYIGLTKNERERLINIANRFIQHRNYAR